MIASLYQKALMDQITSLLCHYNDTNELPADVQLQIHRANALLIRDGLRLKITRVNDGIQKGWVIQFDRA